MFERWCERLLHWLRVPPAPTPPAGAASSVRVFRAGKNYYRLRLLGWGIGQVFTLAGILFGAALLLRLEHDMRMEERSRLTPAAGATLPATPPPKLDVGGHINLFAQNASHGPRAAEHEIARVASYAPHWVFPLLKLLKIGGFLAYLIQVPITYAAVRLDYEQRWYIVTDRSLRIRSGIYHVQELTMSFANLQQVIVSQGPLQRLLRLADVRVRSAGGGGDGEERPGHKRDSMHVGIFHGVENAPEIRDLILERLRLFRAAGLGDPDDHHDHTPAVVAPVETSSIAVAAARELLDEARALRQVLASTR
jgi:hypothetical protein